MLKILRAEIEPRERVLSDTELRAIWAATAGDDDLSKVVRLLLFTATRRSVIGDLSWSEVDLPNATLHIPGARMKAGKPQDIALSGPALAILSAQPRRGERPWVFGRHGRGLQGWSFLKMSLDKRIAETIGRALPQWRFHDLRRSTATRLASDLHIPPHIIDSILAHAPPKLRRTYVTSDYPKEQRAALDAWANRLLEIVGEREPDLNVVDLARRA